MTNAEKLQKLIELAWDNGYAENKIDWREHTASDTQDLVWVLLSGSIEQTAASVVIEGNLENIVLFDHEFIKALCNSVKDEDAKRCVVKLSTGNYHTQSSAAFLREPDKFAEIFEYTLYRVAITTNRIDYLYETFCE